MRPITRETILDRRQPSLRWTAVFAGAVVAIALWVVLQLIGMGAGLAAVDLDDSGSLRNVGVGTTVWSVLAPLIALFVGGLVAGRLATTFDHKVAVGHGVVTWAIASLAGVIAVAWLVSAIAHGAVNLAYGQLPTADNVLIDPSLRAGELAEATDRTGKILLGAGVTLLLSLGATVGGAALAARRFTRPRRRTQEVPVVPPPDEPPSDAPHVNA
jgi:MFS family permease